MGWRFPAVNLMGATLVLISLIYAWNLPSVVLECFWGAISLYGLVRAIRRASLGLGGDLGNRQR